MGINPSNVLDEGLKGFPTLGDPPFAAECKDLAVAELRTAGFPRGCETLIVCEREVYVKGSKADRMARSGIYVPSEAAQSPTEWVTVYDVTAKLYGWHFRRAWYYWMAGTDVRDYRVPKSMAEEFNQRFRTEVRVDGYASGQDVRGDVESYHIDTPNGLLNLIQLLKALEAARDRTRREKMSL